MALESLRCRNCGAALDAARIDRSLGIAVCEHCGGLHELPAAQREPAADGGAAKARAPDPARGTVPLPERFDVNRGNGSLQVRWAKGRRSGAVVLAAFAVIWGVAATSVGVIFLVPVSLFLLYYAAVRGFNRTELRATPAGIDIRRGPLPWRGSRRHVRRADVRQLFAREVIRRTHTDSNDGRKVRERRSYALVALDPAGRKRTLIGALPSPDQALWFERELERVLGIENVRIAGEVR